MVGYSTALASTGSALCRFPVNEHPSLPDVNKDETFDKPSQIVKLEWFPPEK